MVGTRGSAPPGQAAPEQDTNNFNLVWVPFKAAEWTSKPHPRGIGTLWKYIMPGRDPTGTVGVAYYVAREHAVERLHAAQEALTAAVSSRSASVQASKNTSPSKPSTRKTNASFRMPKSPVFELKSSPNPPSVLKTASKSPPKAPCPCLHPIHRPSETSLLVLRSPSASKSIGPVSPAQGITKPDSVTTEVSAHTTQQPDIRVTRGGDERDGGDGESKEKVPAEVSGVCYAVLVLQSTVDISGGAEDELNHSQDDNEKYSVLESGNEYEEEYLS
ncbi:hypothetical protein PI124_g10687 [Phytophthora idaei]|nr:hypothetical protein PI125_g3466 [Phytophthora idaei]KAG3167786.1 hypothetical protein PI126_g3637 [Phytophthora idaei]KAG3244511.1 hypothetical protein PI124_g10687 [Phytophthora idaei]